MIRWELLTAAVAQLVLLAVLWMSVGLGMSGWLAGLGYVGATLLVLAVALRGLAGRSMGPANRVTLGRAVLVGGVAALVVDRMGERAPFALVLVAVVALGLDAVDGYVARRTGTASLFGARFDIEVDAFLVLLLSVFVAAHSGVWVVLAIGGMRYLFVAAGWALPWLNAPLPPSLARKVVGAVQGIALVVVSSGLLLDWVSVAVVWLALFLLVLSFGRDILWLLCHRKSAR